MNPPISPPSPIAPPSSIKAKLELTQAKLEKAHLEGRTEFTDVLGFIAHCRRVDATQADPQPFRLIAIELSSLSGVDLTHEAVRRWHRWSQQVQAAHQAAAVLTAP